MRGKRDSEGKKKNSPMADFPISLSMSAPTKIHRMFVSRKFSNYEFLTCPLKRDKGLFLFIFIPKILTNRERSFDISNGMPPIFRGVH